MSDMIGRQPVEIDKPFEYYGDRVRWFGESWGAPICEERVHISTPVGSPCNGHPHMHGGKPAQIKDGDQGIVIPYIRGPETTTMAFHLLCWMHEIGEADRITSP